MTALDKANFAEKGYSQMEGGESTKKWIIRMIRCAFCELLGCLLLVYIGTLQSFGNNQLITAFAHGITIAINIMAMGHISGGHFNPAVTLAVTVTGNIRITQAAIYVVSQLFGGFLGSLLARATLSQDAFEYILGGATIPNVVKVTALQGIICEAVLTFILVNAVLCTAVDTNSNLLAPLAIGFSVFVDILAGGAISGASMNPARSFGPAVVASLMDVEGVWKMHQIYWIGPLVGALLAALIYKMLLAKDEKRWFGEKSDNE